MVERLIDTRGVRLAAERHDVALVVADRDVGDHGHPVGVEGRLARRCARPRTAVRARRAVVVGLGRLRSDGRDADPAGHADEAAARARREPEEVFARGRLHGEAVEARRRAEAVRRYGADVDAGEGRSGLRLRVDRAVLTDVGLRVLVEDRDADRHADADVATGEARGDLQHLAVVARRHEHVVAGVDRHAVRRRVAGVRDIFLIDRGRLDPVAEAGVRVQVHQGHGERAGDADLTTGRAGDDGDDAVLRGRGDRDVLRGVHDRAAADVRVGEDLDQVDARADADAGGAADGDRRGDAELVVAVAGRDEHRLLGIRARHVRGAGGTAVDLGVRADVRLGPDRDHVDGAADVHRDRARDAGGHADRRDVVAVRRRDAHAAEGGAVRRDGARAALARVTGRVRSVRDQAVAAAGRAAGERDVLRQERTVRAVVVVARAGRAGVRGRSVPTDRVALRRGETHVLRVRRVVDDRVVRLTVGQAADRRAAAGAVDDLRAADDRRRRRVAAGRAARRVRQVQRVADAVDVRVEPRRLVLLYARLVEAHQAVVLAVERGR